MRPKQRNDSAWIWYHSSPEQCTTAFTSPGMYGWNDDGALQSKSMRTNSKASRRMAVCDWSRMLNCAGGREGRGSSVGVCVCVRGCEAKESDKSKAKWVTMGAQHAVTTTTGRNNHHLCSRNKLGQVRCDLVAQSLNQMTKHGPNRNLGLAVFAAELLQRSSNDAISECLQQAGRSTACRTSSAWKAVVLV
jgi:hypothetical protein